MHANTLIELAMQHTERKSVRALAERIGVSHTKVSEWKTGKKPVPDERIQQLAKVAGQEPGPWLLLIKSEQDEGDLGRLWAKLAKQLTAVAGVVALCAMPIATFAVKTADYVGQVGGLHLMSIRQRCCRWLRRRRNTVWNRPGSHSAVLA